MATSNFQRIYLRVLVVSIPFFFPKVIPFFFFVWQLLLMFLFYFEKGFARVIYVYCHRKKNIFLSVAMTDKRQ